MKGLTAILSTLLVAGSSGYALANGNAASAARATRLSLVEAEECSSVDVDMVLGLLNCNGEVKDHSFFSFEDVARLGTYQTKLHEYLRNRKRFTYNFSTEEKMQSAVEAMRELISGYRASLQVR